MKVPVGDDPPRRPFHTRPRPVEAPAEMDRFVASLRRLQDIAVSVSPDPQGWACAADRVDELCALLSAHVVGDLQQAPAGRATGIPGLGHPLMPPWITTETGPDGVTMRGHFSRVHVGGNDAVHGGMIPLLYDWLFGMVMTVAELPISRTAYLHVDYRSVTPIGEELTVRGRVESSQGRKHFVSAVMTDAQGTVLSEGSGLMVALLPHHL